MTGWALLQFDIAVTFALLLANCVAFFNFDFIATVQVASDYPRIRQPAKGMLMFLVIFQAVNCI